MSFRSLVRLSGALVLTFLLTCGGLCPAATFTVPRLAGPAWEENGLKIGVMSRIGHVGVKNDPSGEAELRLAWDSGALRLFVTVFDPDRFESGGRSLYRGDSIEIFVAPAVGARDYLQIVAAPGIIGSGNESPRVTVIGHDVPEDIKVSGGPRKDGYTLEVVVPWKCLHLTPEKGRKIGFQLIVNDRDVEMAKIADYTKRNNEIDHLCWFPDRTTAFDQTRMHTLVLGEGAGQGSVARADFAPDFSSLRVDASFAYAGKTVSVSQGSALLGRQILRPDARARLAGAVVPITPPDPDGPPLELKAGDELLVQVPLYARTEGDETLSRIVTTGEEKERLEGLRALLERTPDPLLKEDILSLLPLVEIWAEGREMAGKGKFKEPTEYLLGTVNPMSPPAIREDSPLFPVYCLYRVRNLVWRSIQGGYPGEVAEYYALAAHLLAKAKARVPDNPLINLYLGEPQPWPGPPDDPDAPRWANDQRHALEKLREIVHWWIDERQMANGSYGGGWNDDVEMWRNWWPVLLAFEDEKAEAAQALLSSAILEQPHMKAGYSSIMSDVEHSSEDSADTLTPMLYLQPRNPAWREKAGNIARLMREVWTEKNARGNLSFKNIVFNSQATGRDPKNAYDTTLDARAVQPALVYWQMTRDPELTPLFTQWLDTWVEAAASDDNGKPAGVLPSAIHFPDQRIGGPNHWWDTEAFSFLYNWPHYTGDMLHVLVITSFLTGESRYLEPVRSMARLRMDYLARNPGDSVREEIGFTSFGRYWKKAASLPDLEPGSSDWCAAQMGALLPGPLAGYRLLSGDTRFDEVLRRDGDGYIRFLLGGERGELERDLASVAASFSVNRAAYTSEVRWTDRVFRFPSAYLESFLKEELPLPNTRLLYETLTGDPSTWVGCRLAAVRWRTPPENIAALVTGTGRTGFRAELYHFGNQPREITAELLLLRNGSYEAILRPLGAGAGELSRIPLTANGNGAEVRITLPPRTLCELVVRPR